MLDDSKLNITVADLAWSMKDCSSSLCCPMETADLQGIVW